MTIDVFNIRGRRVRTLLQQSLPAGDHAVVWDGTSTDGRAVASGIYLARLQAGTEVRIRKMTLVR